MSLEGVSSKPMQSTAIAPPPANLASLPQELLNQIFRDVSPHDLQNAACVSWGMNRSVKEAAHFNERSSMKNFIKGLMQKLHVPEQKELLEKIAQNLTSQNFPNLLLLKGYILDVKAQLIGVIKIVDEKTANDLRDVRPPHFLEDIFTLAAFERQIDAAHLIADKYRRWEALRTIAQSLAREGYIDRALEVATSIPKEKERGFVLRDISHALTRADNIDRAIAVATSIADEKDRGYALWDISKALTLTRRAGSRERALVVAKLIPNESTRGDALWGISQALLRAGDIDNAIVVAELIPGKNIREFSLRNISQALARAGNIDRSRAVAELISKDENMTQ